MNSHKPVMKSIPWRPLLRTGGLAGGVMVFLLLGALPIRAERPQIPWECSSYEGDAQTRCLNAFIESQRETIAQLEGQLQAQQNTVGQLRTQIESQAATTADLQRQLSERPATSFVPTLYPHTPYAYLYPPILGFGIHFGRPWIYGTPRYYGLHWGHRHHRPWGFHR